ncbi:MULTISPECIES: HD domain-containing protein [unclassified Nodularia (in: cyanobacteria)]|uniref:HD domain-containing protein n=1 Tax=unclassified Nodularia (in: cyanobacteria) TaxID=2656917 RepID=UPI00187F42A9|nr:MULTISPECIES: HD domain-containing protein [unclassified Nodularia (in: cyanobacteria)]MBE9198565.1 HD domain-containing protein [Nodularia sp. LEGE 06071]MCC2693583.1 HD domain-containing protein [Nodularia sp. LEGE 04288]
MKTKAPLPHDFLKNQKVSAIVEAYFEFNHLKQLYRQGWLQRGIPSQNCESVAEHSFCVTLLALFLVESYFPELDKWKVICMALLHDLGEIHAGDFTPLDNVESSEKQRLEYQSVEKVLSKLPGGSTHLALWKEYEAGTSPEARFIHEIDCLEMGLQASVYRQQNLVDPKSFFASAQKVLCDSRLLQILQELESLKICDDMENYDNKTIQ